MKDWMLTWPEIVAARLEYTREVSYQARLKGESTEFDFTNKAQARRIVVWLDEPCNNLKHSVPCEGVDRRRCCSECREQLRKEVGL
jgi:hypothetical protein